MLLNKDDITLILSGHLRSDDVLYELEHFISVQAGGYTQEEADEAMDSFNDIIDSIADKIVSSMIQKALVMLPESVRDAVEIKMEDDDGGR